jgi:hypothetical protein
MEELCPMHWTNSVGETSSKSIGIYSKPTHRYPQQQQQLSFMFVVRLFQFHSTELYTRAFYSFDVDHLQNYSARVDGAICTCVPTEPFVTCRRSF